MASISTFTADKDGFIGTPGLDTLDIAVFWGGTSHPV
jgi:hypothetical protein